MTLCLAKVNRKICTFTIMLKQKNGTYRLALPLLIIIFLAGWLPIRAQAPEGSIPVYNLIAHPSKLSTAGIVEKEQLLDLVGAMSYDSVLTWQTERHRILGGGLLRWLFGMRWESLHLKKEKFIGTSAHEVSIFNGPFMEYDVNYFLIPHLPKYINLQLQALDTMQQALGGKLKRALNYETPFENPDELKDPDGGHLAVEIECTPRKKYRKQLTEKFYPARKGQRMAEHPNFGSKYVTMGFYGPACLDCTHGCRPEIHPYEWIWWVPPDVSDSAGFSWMVGYFKDNTARFKHWTTDPRAGVISLPFAFDASGANATIEIEHLVTGTMQPAAIDSFLVLPAKAQKLPSSAATVVFEHSSAGSKAISIRQKGEAVNEGIRYWLDGPWLDSKNNLIYGRLHLAVGVSDVYAARVRFVNR